MAKPPLIGKQTKGQIFSMNAWNVNAGLANEVDTRADASCVPAGALDGVTILRYAPIYRDRSNGGVEQCLRRLNTGLLRKHRLTVVQVHRVSDVRCHRIDVEEVGRGKIVWVPVAHQRTASRVWDLPERASFVYDQTFAWCRQHGAATPRSVRVAIEAVVGRRMEALRHRSVVLSEALGPLLQTLNVDLVALHGLTLDAAPLVRRARRLGLPFALINHFDNSAFSEPHVREWLPFAASIGSVSGRGLPDHVRASCVPLLDGIDTDFFAPDTAASGRVSETPVIFLPALIKPGKGQKDLLRAARIMADRGVEFSVCFAGAVESDELRQDLAQYVEAAGLRARVRFLGELAQEEVRNRYSACHVVALPSYTEGLPRVLLEAQAMQKPVVAYDSSGGIGETFLADETGFLVKTGDVDTLADRLEYLVTNQAAQIRMGERGRQFVAATFGLAKLIERHEAFYLASLSRRPSSRRE